MSEVVDGFREEATLLVFDGNNCVAKEREYDANVYDMFFRTYENSTISPR